MNEVVTSVYNKNSLLYGTESPIKNEGPACVDRQGEDINVYPEKPTEAPFIAVREK